MIFPQEPTSDLCPTGGISLLSPFQNRIKSHKKYFLWEMKGRWHDFGKVMVLRLSVMMMMFSQDAVRNGTVS